MLNLRVRRMLVADGAVAFAAGAIALDAAPAVAERLAVTPSSVRAVGAVLFVLGVDAWVLAAVERRSLVAPFTVLRELALAAILVVGLRDGLGAADVVVGALLAEAIVAGWAEARAVRGRPGTRMRPRAV